MSSGPPTAWKALPYSFTTIFGTALNGSEITWYNDPTADSASTDRTELKFHWIQNLFSTLYTFYDGADTTGDD